MNEREKIDHIFKFSNCQDCKKRFDDKRTVRVLDSASGRVVCTKCNAHWIESLTYQMEEL